jgi:hypothetical protein
MNPFSRSQPSKSSFGIFAIAIGLISFGLTMLVFSAAYTRDLAGLANAPFAVWSALCGQPSDSPLTLSVLVSMSGLALVAGIFLFGFGALRRRW